MSVGASGRGDGASNGDALGIVKSTQGADRGRQTVHKRSRSERTTVTVELGQVEVEGKGELVGRDTRRTHVVRLADVVAGVRRTVKRRRQPNTRSCYGKGEKTQGSPPTDSDCDTNAATADSGENEVRRGI